MTGASRRHSYGSQSERHQTASRRAESDPGVAGHSRGRESESFCSVRGPRALPGERDIVERHTQARKYQRANAILFGRQIYMIFAAGVKKCGSAWHALVPALSFDHAGPATVWPWSGPGPHRGRWTPGVQGR
jgi:hypothetical protein